MLPLFPCNICFPNMLTEIIASKTLLTQGWQSRTTSTKVQTIGLEIGVIFKHIFPCHSNFYLFSFCKGTEVWPSKLEGKRQLKNQLLFLTADFFQFCKESMIRLNKETHTCSGTQRHRCLKNERQS